ncbi:MAG: hypothetical protein JRN68_06640 [Nitrososphaerota archaeon]|nr:hypothetical protein [Nitrososphaerota archaeon]
MSEIKVVEKYEIVLKDCHIYTDEKKLMFVAIPDELVDLIDRDLIRELFAGEGPVRYKNIGRLIIPKVHGPAFYDSGYILRAVDFLCELGYNHIGVQMAKDAPLSLTGKTTREKDITVVIAPFIVEEDRKEEHEK